MPADLSLFESYTRRDLDHAGPASARPTTTTRATSGSPLAYRDHGYDDDWARDEAEFAVVDPGLQRLVGLVGAGSR